MAWQFDFYHDSRNSFFFFPRSFFFIRFNIECNHLFGVSHVPLADDLTCSEFIRVSNSGGKKHQTDCWRSTVLALMTLHATK